MELCCPSMSLFSVGNYWRGAIGHSINFKFSLTIIYMFTAFFDSWICQQSPQSINALLLFHPQILFESYFLKPIFMENYHLRKWQVLALACRHNLYSLLSQIVPFWFPLALLLRDFFPDHILLPLSPKQCPTSLYPFLVIEG